MNRLYFGDCLDVMREDIPDESVGLIYLDPPFNSKRIYNAFIGGAQWVAFKDTWQWYEAVDDFHDVAGSVSMAATMEGLRTILGEGPDLAYLSYLANRLRECRRVLTGGGSIYLHCDPTMSYYLRIVMDAIFGKQNFRNEIVWHYGLGGFRAKSWFPRKHDIILFYVKGTPHTFRVQRGEPTKAMLSKYRHRDEDGRRYMLSYGKRYYLKGGKPFDSVWDIPSLAPTANERVGYPTQKPVALLDRILKVSCPPDGVVMDPFCGCGTTLHAAQNLGLRWIGIDICVKACQVIEKRLKQSFDTLWDQVQFLGLPKTRDEAKTLASYDAFRFERWAASLVDGMEYNKVQTGDKGIDGRGRVALRKGYFIDLVAQVKGGHTGPGDVQAFNGARQQAKADLGFFTCFEERVTTGMRNAAASTGRFLEVPVIQIYTIEDYFERRRPEIPAAK